MPIRQSQWLIWLSDCEHQKNITSTLFVYVKYVSGLLHLRLQGKLIHLTLLILRRSTTVERPSFVDPRNIKAQYWKRCYVLSSFLYWPIAMAS